MARGIDFKQKEVINLKNGSVIGYVNDVNADFTSGNIKSVIVSPVNKFGSIFKGNNNIVIPWDKIIKIGEDVILVEI